MSGNGRRRDDRAPDVYRARAVVAAFNNHFEAEPEVVVRAPGRNTAIGDHLDYPPLPRDGRASSRTIAWASQGNVLVAGRRRPDQALKLFAVNYGQAFSISLDDLEGLAQEASNHNLTDIYGQEPHTWALNVLALLYSAHHGRQGVRTGLPLCGAELLFEGNVPMGAGQSSSAAFLVAVTLALNEMFGWGIPADDLFTLADLARSGEHEDYTPFIRHGRAGYLDQIASLAAVAGKAVVIDHGDYRTVRRLDLSRIEQLGYVNAVVHSGLSRSLSATEYGSRVSELARLPALLNEILAVRRPGWPPKAHIHAFTAAEWRDAERELERRDPTLARRARYVFEEKARTEQFITALDHGDIGRMVELVNASGDAMSMSGPYQISGTNELPSGERIAALDTLREIVLRHAGRGAAARMMGGGGAGALYLLVPREKLRSVAFQRAVADEWRARTGLTARITRDPPAAGAGVVWRRGERAVVQRQGERRIEIWQDITGQDVYALIDARAGICAEIVPSAGTVRGLRTDIGGTMTAVLFNPEVNAAQNGAMAWSGPGQAGQPDARAPFRDQPLALTDGGWALVRERLRITDDALELACTRRDATAAGPLRTTLAFRVEGRKLVVRATLEHEAAHDDTGLHVPLLAAVRPWVLLHGAKHRFAEVQTNGSRRPAATLHDWFRDLAVRVKAEDGFDSIAMHRPLGVNAVALAAETGGVGRPIPTLGPGERFEAAVSIEVGSLSALGVRSPFAAPEPRRRPPRPGFPTLIANGMETGPLAEPGETATHKDAVRVFYQGRWHIYGTGHEMKDPSNPPPGHRPHRGSILFHLIGDRLDGPYTELHPPVLLGNFPPGIYEAPSLVAEGDTLHLFAQTTYYQLGRTIEHFVSTDGQRFTWKDTALRSVPGGQLAGIYDVDVAVLRYRGRDRATILYSGFSRPGSRDDRPDPVLFLGCSTNGLDGPWQHGERPILTDADVPWHNSHDPANPLYEWGLEGAQLLPLPDGGYLLLSVAFEKRPGRAYMPAQRLLFARYDDDMRLVDVSDPILPLVGGWDEYGHGSMMFDPEDPRQLRLLFQARPRNDDGAFRDSNTWRLFEARFSL